MQKGCHSKSQKLYNVITKLNIKQRIKTVKQVFQMRSSNCTKGKREHYILLYIYIIMLCHMLFTRIRIRNAKLNIVPFCSTTSSPRSASIATQLYYDTIIVRTTSEQPQVNSILQTSTKMNVRKLATSAHSS